MSDVILKNQAGYEETYDNIDELRTTTASGTGEQTFVIPPIIQYDLINHYYYSHHNDLLLLC